MGPAPGADPGGRLRSAPAASLGTLRVLVVEFDLFDSVGGGQTAYRRLIAANPHIDFYYLGVEEKPRTPPGGARAGNRDANPWD